MEVAENLVEVTKFGEKWIKTLRFATDQTMTARNHVLAMMHTQTNIISTKQRY